MCTLLKKKLKSIWERGKQVESDSLPRLDRLKRSWTGVKEVKILHESVNKQRRNVAVGGISAV